MILGGLQVSQPDGRFCCIFSGSSHLTLQGIVLVLHLLMMLNALMDVVLPCNQPTKLQTPHVNA